MRAAALARRIWPHRDRLLLVVDGAGWILDEIGEHLTACLPTALAPTVVSRDWATARNCVIHFIDRPWAWSDGVLERVHPSNRLIGLWWHGRPETADASMRQALHRLQKLHRRFARIQVTCRIGRDTMRSLGVPDEKVVMLPEGVDLDLFRPASDPDERRDVRARLGIPEAALVVGCFQKDGDGWGAGLQPKLIKGPDTLADALIRLSRMHPVHALMPGPARGYVCERLREAGVPVSAPGFVLRTELPSLYHAVDVYVSPSRDEGGPAGVLEAMACGVAVVSTRTGMAADLIENGRNGMLVDVGDASGLADAVHHVAQSADVRGELVRAGAVTIGAFGWSEVAARYARELYAGVTTA